MTREDKLQELLMELYVTGLLCQDRLHEADQERVLSTVLAAAEGRDFELLGLPFPKDARGIALCGGL